MRRDGKRVKVESAEYAIVPHIMPQRNDALNMIEIDIPLKPIQDYLNSKRKQGINLSHLGVIVAAYARILGEYPMLNRFVVNKTIYARNEFNVGMVVLKGGHMDNGTMSKVNFDPADTVFDIDRKMSDYIEANRSETGENATDRLANILIGIPGLLGLGVCVFKWMDKHGLLPRTIIDASPFHTSLTISNLASIRTNSIFHHIYNFGTTGVFITMGVNREVARKDREGNVYFEKCIPFGVVMDERICSGSYFSQAFRTFRKYLSDPSLLETLPEDCKIIKEIAYRKDKYPVTKEQ